LEFRFFFSLICLYFILVKSVVNIIKLKPLK